MPKISLGPKPQMYPMPIVLVGAVVEDKPNFLAVAFCGIVNVEPPMVAIGLAKDHHTNVGIKANNAFSINIPSVAMAVVTDHCGLVSGKNRDKAGLFTVFYGKDKAAPLIQECPVCLECQVKSVTDLGRDELFLGMIADVHVEEGCMTGGKPDIRKIDPLIFSFGDNSYWKLGEFVGKAWNIGKGYKG